MFQSKLYTDSLTRTAFLKLVGILGLTYLILELVLIPHLMLAYDEFWFAQHIYQYTQQLPYRDFLPYKTVLGYYLLTFPLWLSHEFLTPVFLIKDQIAFCNAIILCGVSVYAMRFFNKFAILFTLLLLFSNQFFLFYSVDLRVDMLSSWVGLISVLFILNQRNRFAGLCLGVSFLISQKALWFLVAINSGFAATLLLRNCRAESFRRLITFNGWACIPVVLYFIGWALVSKPAIVFNSMFYEAYTQSKITWYSQVYLDYWKVILANGPLPIAFIPLTWISLFFAPITTQRIFILTFNTAMLVLFASYQQPFPYNIVFLIPVFFLAYSEFITAIFILWHKTAPLTKRDNRLIFFILFYALGLIALFVKFEITLPYFLMVLIPLCLGIFIYKPHPILVTLISLSFFFTGFFYPLLRAIEFTFVLNNDYQKTNITLLNDLLKKEGDYVAGTPFLYRKQQPVPGLENLISPAIAYLYTSSPALLPILIPSLHLIPTNPQAIIEHLEKQPIKAYVNNNRIMNLPPILLNYLHNQFSHYFGSIYIYTPTINATHFRIKFPGHYRVLAPPMAHVWIDNQIILPNSIIPLDTNNHVSKADQPYRLQLIPTDHGIKPLQYQKDQWQLTAI